MKGENFSLYKNIKHLCRGIYHSIKYNNSKEINSYINTFSQINLELEKRISMRCLQNLQKGGYSKEIERLKNSITQKLIYIKQSSRSNKSNHVGGGGESDTDLATQNAILQQEIIKKIKNFDVKDIRPQLKYIESGLNKIKIFMDTYIMLQNELKRAHDINNTKYNKDSKDSIEALRALMGTITPTEITTLQQELHEFTKNIKTIVDDKATPPEDLEKTIIDTCKSYIPQNQSSIHIEESTA